MGNKQASGGTYYNEEVGVYVGETMDRAFYSEEEYQDLIYLAKKREVRITIQKGTGAGVVAGLCVMGGIMVAGPVGAAVGGAVGTAYAVKHSKDVVSLNQLLEQTPVEKRGEVCHMFAEGFREEFYESIQNNPELKLLLGAGSITSVVRYMVEKDMIQNEQVKKLDNILAKIA